METFSRKEYNQRGQQQRYTAAEMRALPREERERLNKEYASEAAKEYKKNKDLIVDSDEDIIDY